MLIVSAGRTEVTAISFPCVNTLSPNRRRASGATRVRIKGTFWTHVPPSPPGVRPRAYTTPAVPLLAPAPVA